MASDSNGDRKIQLRVSNHKAYVWDVEDIATLRAQHHICGVLTGTLPHLSQQNVFLGVPLVLLPEEVVLLVEKQLAVLIDDPNAHQPADPESLARWNAERESSAKRQIAVSEAERSSEKAAKLSTSEAAVQKRKEREAKRAAAARAKALAEGLPIDDIPVSAPSSTPNTEERPATPARSTIPAFNVVIPASSTEIDWYSPDAHAYSSLSTARAAGLWSYPITPYERAKCRVFQDLWEKGNFMGGGIKFGGDFLVYPGDPLRYHSHFVATVIESPTSPLTPMEVVAHGRLGTATKKSHLFCEWDEVKQEVTYYSVEWAGFG
ncbi:tRNA-intron endonuclease catalytic domain-like protein [Trametes meyenii]|nr:tRNA-intron endonuclease catalytic domain-like protein [Trametes meyenii]